MPVADVVALATELEAKIEERLPGIVKPNPPATPGQIRLAELQLGEELTDDLRALFEFHNGCSGYPMHHSLNPLEQALPRLELHYPFPHSGGPFEERSSVAFAEYPGQQYLISPLEGDYRGHVFRMTIDGYNSCYVTSSIASVFESWLFYLDNDFLSPSSSRDTLVPTQPPVDGSEALEPFGLLLAAWPAANPLALLSGPDPSDPKGAAFVAERQTPYGIDERLDPRHPQHQQWFEQTADDLERQDSET